MQKLTLGFAAVVMASFLAGDALAEHSHGRDGLSHGAYISAVAHHGRSAHSRHGSYYSGRHGSYYRPGLGYPAYRGYPGYHGHHGYHGYHPRVIVTPPACGYPRVHGVYRPYYPPVNSFYYNGRNFGIGINF
jgi:hypothetical protein